MNTAHIQRMIASIEGRSVKPIYSFTPDFEDIWTQDDQELYQKSMQTTITTEQYTALQTIAQGMNRAIAEYNDSNRILHPLIWVGVNHDEEHVFFEVKHFRTHGMSEEQELHYFIDGIARTLVDAGLPDTLQSGSETSFTAIYELNVPA